MNTLGQRFRCLRESAGSTTRDFAKLLDISQGYVSQIERDAANLSAKTVTAIATKLNVSPTWLLTGEGDKYPDASIALSRHPDRWMQDFLESLVKYWMSSNARQQWVVANTLSSTFGAAMHTWMAERNPPLEPHELKNVPNLDNLLDDKLMGQLREVSPELADKMQQIVSSLLLATIQDYCDFLKEWWDRAADDERTWARVELKRRLPMLF